MNRKAVWSGTCVNGKEKFPTTILIMISFSCESKETLEEHMTKNTKKYMCDSCGFKANDPNKLYYHRHVTHEAVMVPCPDCGKMFKDRYLKLHQRKVHSAAACEICGVVVKNVKHHMQGVHMADSDKRFHCKDCGKGFMCRVTMDNHRMNMHIKAQPQFCRYGCDYRYNGTSNRNAHERLRHGAVWTADHAKLQKWFPLQVQTTNYIRGDSWYSLRSLWTPVSSIYWTIVRYRI